MIHIVSSVFLTLKSSAFTQQILAGHRGCHQDGRVREESANQDADQLRAGF